MAQNSACRSKAKALTALLIPLVLLSGCNAVDRVKQEFEAIRLVLTGGKGVIKPRPQASASPAAEELSSEGARKAKMNAELLREMFLVVYLREPRDRSEFGSLVDSLNQGASFEGIYNGFTHSANYRKLEVANSSSTPQAVKVFAEELAILQAELAAPTRFDTSAAKPLAPSMGEEPQAHDDPAASDTGVSEVQYGKAKPSPKPSAPPQAAAGSGLAARFEQDFGGASVYTLKRILGDEVMKVIDAKKGDRAKLAEWYSKWVTRLAGKGIDFGISLRNKADEAFHRDWAAGATEDQIRWESLNRVHRLVNEANRTKP